MPSWRLVSSRFPPAGLYDRVASPSDLEAVIQVESLTNERLRNELGQIHLVPEDQRVFGEGTTPIMAAFTHLNPLGSRFSDGSYGVYYAAKKLDTAVAETQYHRERFLRATKEEPIEIDMRSYASDIDSDCHDVRGQQRTRMDIYDPDPSHYGPAQAFAKGLRAAQSNGIAYSSVRDDDGECVAIFRPDILSPVRQGPHLCYVWDGSVISDIYTKSEYPSE